MKHLKNRLSKLTALYISIILLLGQISAVYAADLPIVIGQGGNGSSAAGGSDSAAVGVSGLRITDVDAPVPGMPLDTAATVTSAEGVQWEIPVMWVNDGGSIAEGIAEDRLYFPVLVFAVPEGYTVLDRDSETGAFLICVDDSLSDLFGEDLLTVWLAEYGITLIFPGTVNLEAILSRLTGVLFPVQQSYGVTASVNNMDEDGAAAAADPADDSRAGSAEAPSGAMITSDDPLERLVDVHCSSSALYTLGKEELKTLLDLIVYRLQPQAVNLLVRNFPAFLIAYDERHLGNNISLYVYFKEGDMDGRPEHEEAVEGAVAYIRTEQKLDESESVRFYYLLAVDASSVSRQNDTGEWVLDLDNEAKLSLLGNTLLHEMFHAFAYDCIRTGMCGAVRAEDLIIDDSLSGEERENAIKRQTELYNATLYPAWFTEGLASAMENVYQYRHDLFQHLRYDSNLSGQTASFSAEGILKAYLTENFPDGSQNGMLTYDLENAGKNQDSLGAGLSNTPAKYVSGYLACLYLAELAAYERNTYAAVDWELASMDLCYGINCILDRLYNGETLDSVISRISGGRYEDTDDFERKFIKGESTGSGANTVWQGDGDSLLFCSDLLNILLAVDNNDSFEHFANGSVLFDFNTDFESPLDRTKTDSSDIYIIAESSELLLSSVSNDVALNAGGKSRSIHDQGTTGMSVGGTAGGKPLQAATQAPKEAGVQIEKEAGVQAAEEAEIQAGNETAEPEGAGEIPAVPASEGQGSAEQSASGEASSIPAAEEQGSAAAEQSSAEGTGAAADGTDAVAAEKGASGEASSIPAVEEQGGVVAEQSSAEQSGAAADVSDAAAAAGQGTSGEASSVPAAEEQSSPVAEQSGTE